MHLAAVDALLAETAAAVDIDAGEFTHVFVTPIRRGVKRNLSDHTRCPMPLASTTMTK